MSSSRLERGTGQDHDAFVLSLFFHGLDYEHLYLCSINVACISKTTHTHTRMPKRNIYRDVDEMCIADGTIISEDRERRT